MAAYYNEIDPYAAEWLRNLIAAGHIAPGDVDTRSITEVQPDDLRGYTQCHFFAGIGGWSRALRLAGWSDDRPVWTGSCPCQPFSLAGKQDGFADPRHLWPQFKRLIAERRPSIVFGEQVAGAAGWLGLVRGDLEALDYAVGAIPMEAASAGADHYRDRYWFVADRDVERAGERRLPRGGQLGGAGGHSQDHPRAVADGTSERWVRGEASPWAPGRLVVENGDCRYVECPDGKWRRLPPPGVRWLGNGIPARVAKLRALGNAIDPRPAAAFIAACEDAVA